MLSAEEEVSLHYHIGHFVNRNTTIRLFFEKDKEKNTAQCVVVNLFRRGREYVLCGSPALRKYLDSSMIHYLRRRESLLVTSSPEMITVATSEESLKGTELSISVKSTFLYLLA
jgi:hypothetical protein